MRSSVQKWGNSLAIRIPKSFADEVHLNQGSAVDIRLVEEKLQITPIKEKQITLKQLLNDVTEDNLHNEISTGSPVGKEVW